jgi:hypothetical protein
MMPGKRCAYLTMENSDGWSIDAHLGFPPMQALGWQIEAVPWRTSDGNWDQFDAVYIGTPWDYPEDPDQFLSVLESIDKSNAILINDLELVRWSLSKTYLRDLEAKGAAIVPSLWYDDMTPRVLEQAFDKHATDRIIVKPIVSTNATHTFLLTQEQAIHKQHELRTIFRNRPFVVQPFIDNIQCEGEFSLFYFNREFSHATRKVPKKEDFRVQEEYGAEVLSIVPEPALLETGAKIIQLVDPTPAYARADFVRGPDRRFLVMELEMIEPSMYLRMDSNAPQRFAAAIDNYVASARARGQS